MSQQREKKEPALAGMQNYRRYSGRMRWLVLGLGAALCLWILIYVSGIILIAGGWLHPMFHKATFLAITITIVFLLYPARGSAAIHNRVTWYDLVFIVMGLVPNLYVFIFSRSVISISSMGTFTSVESIMGIMLIISILEGCRRVVGWVLPLIGLAFVLHPFIGDYLPGVLWTPDLSLERIIGSLYLRTDGIMGFILGILATMVVAFILFGQLFQATGAGKYLVNGATAIAGRFTGGPAKVAVIASGLFASVSGSASANIGITGSVTIPMMKRMGYPPNLAGGIEAVASNAGIITPPVMGAVAFIMAEILGISYIQVCLAAALPAVLYYAVLLFSVHFESNRLGLKGLPPQELPSLWGVVKKGWFLVIPLVILLWLLISMHYTPQKACFWAIIALVVVSSISKESRLGREKLIASLDSVVPIICMIGITGAIAAVIMASLTLTGFGVKFGSVLNDLAGGNLLPLLLMAALASFILGMGSTATPCYIIVAVIAAPAAIDLGVVPVAAHLFAFWWGIASFITPPVCVNAYFAAGLAGGDLMKTGWNATRLGVASYIVPFLFCFYPALVLQGPLIELPWVIITAIAGAGLLASGLSGYLLVSMNWPQRGLVLVAAFLFMIQGSMWLIPHVGVDLIALGITFGVVIWQYRSRHIRKQGGVS